MGEQVKQSLASGLVHIPISEFERVLAVPQSSMRMALVANLVRINALYMIARAGSGHIGSSFSSVDILTWLHLQEMTPEDIFFSSKGHDAPGYYALMIGLGRLPFKKLHQLRRYQGLPGHPDVSIPVCATNTGSLGMGISKAKGMLFARHLRQKQGRIFVMTGDGELQEGQIWESLISAANDKLNDLIVIVDHNKLQSDTFVHKTSDLGDLVAKFTAFGWHPIRCDGHDYKALEIAFAQLRTITDQPKVIIADTVKGRGVSFMEHTSLDSDITLYRFHSGAPDYPTYQQALTELLSQVKAQLDELNLPELSYIQDESIPKASSSMVVERLLVAYSKALVEQAQENPNIVALDADLVLDTGLIPFRDTFPNRFIECGIAEQDMVSQAGGMALAGLLPVVHSFACFLTARPNEQIYNNATEHSRIVYVGSLAGVLPGGPGHSHQAVRDIAALSAIPGMEMLEPCCSQEVSLALEYCLNRAPGSTYLRLVSVPCAIPFSLPVHYELEPGRGVELRSGQDAVVFGYGPILLNQAWIAAESLAQQDLTLRIVNLPWLNQVASDWLMSMINGVRCIITLDNHQIEGGQGQLISSTLGRLANTIPMIQLGIRGLPVCGSQEEVLAIHGLNADHIERVVLNALGTVKIKQEG